MDLATHRGYPAQNPENPDDVWGDEERDQQFEIAFRHPGDDAKDDDPSRRIELWSGEDTFQALTTVAARDVYGLAFAGNGSAAASSVADGASESKTPQTPSGSNVTEMHAGTLCTVVRIDHRNASSRLLRGRSPSVDPDMVDTLSTRREIQAFVDIVGLEQRGRGTDILTRRRTTKSSLTCAVVIEDIHRIAINTPRKAVVAPVRVSLGAFLSARQLWCNTETTTNTLIASIAAHLSTLRTVAPCFSGSNCA